MLWSQFHPSGKHVLTFGGDGALFLRSITDGASLATFVPVGQEDYVIVDTHGEYAASKYGIEGVAFRISNQVYPFEQFDLYRNRPDLVLKAIGSENNTLIAAYNRAFLRRLQRTMPGSKPTGMPTTLPRLELFSSPHRLQGPLHKTKTRGSLSWVKAVGCMVSENHVKESRYDTVKGYIPSYRGWRDVESCLINLVAASFLPSF